VSDLERTWGATPVPDRLQTFSLLDVGVLWGNLGNLGWARFDLIRVRVAADRR